jgi:hypothetical protein
MKMNRKLFLFSLLLPYMFLCSCNTFEDMFKSEGPQTTEERLLNPIDSVKLTKNVDLVVHYDSLYHMRVTAGSHLLEKIETNINYRTLSISNTNKFNWVRKLDPTIIVEIWVPTLKSIFVENASGDINFEDTLRADRFDFNSFGSIGTFRLLLKCKESYLKMHTGASDMKVRGQNEYNLIYNAGDGKFDCLELQTNQTYLINRGTNDVFSNVKIDFFAKLQSIGNIYYKGTPSTITTEITGKGKVIPI